MKNILAIDFHISYEYKYARLFCNTMVIIVYKCLCIMYYVLCIMNYVFCIMSFCNQIKHNTDLECNYLEWTHKKTSVN